MLVWPLPTAQVVLLEFQPLVEARAFAILEEEEEQYMAELLCRVLTIVLYSATVGTRQPVGHTPCTGYVEEDVPRMAAAQV